MKNGGFWRRNAGSMTVLSACPGPMTVLSVGLSVLSVCSSERVSVLSSSCISGFHAHHLSDGGELTSTYVPPPSRATRLTPSERALLAAAAEIVREATERQEAEARADAETKQHALKHRRAMKLEGDL